jgi:hypothetical protein
MNLKFWNAMHLAPTPYLKSLYQEFEEHLYIKMASWPEANPMTVPLRYAVEGGGEAFPSPFNFNDC